MHSTLSLYTEQIETLARSFGLDYYPVDFEVVPPSFMMEVAVYGLPVRMPHWSFGVRFIYQFVQHRMGNSKIFEVVFPGNPGHAYLANTNSLAENTLVTAHVLGHADFSKNNLLFDTIQRQVSDHIVEQAAIHAHHIEEALEVYGQERVEVLLDCALALEQHIDTDHPLIRPPFSKKPETHARPDNPFLSRFDALPGTESRAGNAPPKFQQKEKEPFPRHPEKDILWFIAHYAPDLEDWERDIFLAVRRESFYFYPVFACQIMNEGWASYWHARLLREADFLPQGLYVDAIKSHSDVVRPYAGENQVAIAINPYHLGFVMWEKIIQERGLEAAFTIRAEEDDFSFIRNYLDADLARELDLFVYTSRRNGEVKVTDQNIHAIHEAILAPKYNFSAPRITVSELRQDGTLVLRQDYGIDGRGLDLERTKRVLDYIHRVWKRSVKLYTMNARGDEEILTAS